MCLFKSQTHVANYCKFQLSTDIEKKSGPRSVYVDPSKTVAALYKAKIISLCLEKMLDNSVLQWICAALFITTDKESVLQMTSFK